MQLRPLDIAVEGISYSPIAIIQPGPRSQLTKGAEAIAEGRSPRPALNAPISAFRWTT